MFNLTTDTGVGLSAKQQESLFKRFYQATPKTQTTYGGSGLGLYISRKISQLLGGECGLESESGQGSIFTFFVETVVTANPSPVHKPSPKDKRSKLPHFTGFTVLLVEDNLVNQKLLAKQLSRSGCTVLTADHGGLALNALTKCEQESVKVDICLMDVEMPEVDGLSECFGKAC